MSEAVMKAKKPKTPRPAKKPVVKAQEPASDSSIEIVDFREAHGSFAEAYSMGTEFCTLNESNIVLHSFTYCKDFITDIFWGARMGHKVSIYSFTWDGENRPFPAMAPQKMLIRDRRLGELPIRAANTQAFLNLFERDLQLEGLSRCVALEDKKCVYVESPSQEWIDYPAMISLWTLVMRVGFNDFDPKNFDPEMSLADVLKAMLAKGLKTNKAGDAGRIKTVEGFLSKLSKGKFRETLDEFTYERYKSASIGTVHNSSGIMATIGKITGKGSYDY